MFMHRQRIARARALHFAAVALVGGGLGGGRHLHAQVWDGGHPSSDDWGSGRNWNPDGPPANDGSADIIMSDTLRLTPNVDEPWDIHLLRFNSSAGPFVIGGSPLIVRPGGIENASFNVQAFNNKIFPRGSQTWDAFSAPMVFNDLIEAFIGAPTLTVDGAFDVTFNGNLTESGVTLELAKTGTGTLTLNGSSNTYTGATTVSAGKLLLATDLTTSSSIGVSGGVLELAAGGGSNRIIRTQSVSVTGGKLDLVDNQLVVTAMAIGTWNGSAYTGVAGLIDAGRGSASDAQWNGSGIVTSGPNAIGSGNLTSLGIATAGQLGRTTFGGLLVAPTDVLVMFTWGGDANLDGKINIDDYGRIDSNVGAPGANGWFNGDFNYDGKINIDDYGIIDTNITQQSGVFDVGGTVASATAGGVVAVPEPALLAGLGLVPLLGRRRLRRPKSSRVNV